MKPHTGGGTTISSTLLTASVFLAQIDMNGMVDYALKAAIGGAIWLGYKIFADRIDRHRKAIEGGRKGE